MQTSKISIIGAGPAGNYLAYLLAKNNQDVSVYEEHKKIGLPIQCTGILTHSINDIIKIPDNIIANKIKKYNIIAPDNSSIEFNLKQPDLILHRDKFDLYLANLATKAGAKYNLNTKYIANNYNNLLTKTNNQNQRHLFDFLIGADGPNSQVAKNNGLWCNRKFIMGQQILAKLKHPQDKIDVYLGIGNFAWIVPEGKGLFRIGIIAENNSYNIMHYFLNRLEIQLKQKIKPIHNQSGIIPIFNSSQQTIKNNIFLLGDAACQVKATSYGGVIHGLLAAQCINNKITKNESKDKYESQHNNLVTKDLQYSVLIRKILNNFSQKDYNDLIKMITKPEAKALIEEYDRNFPSKFLFKLAMAQPRLMKFSTKIF